MEYALKTKSLTKYYKQKAAVDHIDMKVKAGDIYGFIGQNGAGKSTTLKMACGLVHPSEGEVELFHSPVTDPSVRQRVGMLIENAGLYPNLTASENMMLQAMNLGLTDFTTVEKLLDLLSLSSTGKKKVRQFSMGMKQRLGIAMALLGNPDFLILDEPINGLDPEGIRQIREFLIKLNEEEGKTILISSHILGELSKIATTYGIIKDGRLIRQITKAELEEQCKDYMYLEVDDIERAAAVISEHIKNIDFEICGKNQVHLYDFTDTGMLTSLLVSHGVSVSSCGLHQTDLEHYFLDLMEGGGLHA